MIDRQTDLMFIGTVACAMHSLRWNISGLKAEVICKESLVEGPV